MPLPDRRRSERPTGLDLVTRLSALITLLVLAGCASTTQMGPPEPTPADITGIAADFQREGVTISSLVSGDAGCTDPDMIASAIAFEATGLDAPQSVPMRIYIFRDAESYGEQRTAVDACIAEWIGDPAGLEVLDASPYVLVGQGPWTPELKAAVRDGLTAAAGNGG